MIKAIETQYNGYRFRSRLEARWAIFFDIAGIAYHYEPEGYDLSSAVCEVHTKPPLVGPYGIEGLESCVCPEIQSLQGKDCWYLPDFFLPQVTLRYEPTPGLFFEVKGILNTKDENRCKVLGAVTGKPVILAAINTPGSFEEGGNRIIEEGLEQIWPWWDTYMVFMRCANSLCGHIKIEFWNSHYMSCPKCNSPTIYNDPVFTRATRAAKQARF
ncbi:MAG TPA: hypothetical protein VF077_12380 [Nitrospiraceae bacterium]